MERKSYKKIDFSDAGIIFLISVILFLISNLLLSFIVPRSFFEGNSYYFVVGLVELIAIGLPPVIYIILKRISLKSILGERFSVEQATLTFFLAIFGMPVIGFIRLVWVYLLQAIHIPIYQPQFPPMQSFWMIIVGLIAVSIIPATSEELLFRGVMQGVLQNKKRVIKAILITSLLFALMHGDVSALTYTFTAGIIMGCIYYYTGSLWLSIIYHATNNAISILATVFVTSVGYDKLMESSEAMPEMMEATQDIFTLIIMFVMMIICIGICALLIWAFKKVSKPRKAIVLDQRPIRKIEYLPFYVGGALLLIITLVPTIIEMLM
jgi:membrane protease YdiL (CAAX protease family)